MVACFGAHVYAAHAARFEEYFSCFSCTTNNGLLGECVRLRVRVSVRVHVYDCKYKCEIIV